MKTIGNRLLQLEKHLHNRRKNALRDLPRGEQRFLLDYLNAVSAGATDTERGAIIDQHHASLTHDSMQRIERAVRDFVSCGKGRVPDRT
jgi:hypothetical protein